MRNVLTKILNGIVVSDSDFPGDRLDLSLFSVFGLFHFFGDSFDFSLVLVFDDFLFEGDVFDSAFSLDDFFASVDGGANDILSVLASAADCVLSSGVVVGLVGVGACSVVVGGGSGGVAGDVAGGGGGYSSADCVVGAGVVVDVLADGFTGLAVDKLGGRHVQIKNKLKITTISHN